MPAQNCPSVLELKIKTTIKRTISQYQSSVHDPEGKYIIGTLHICRNVNIKLLFYFDLYNLNTSIEVFVTNDRVPTCSFPATGGKLDGSYCLCPPFLAHGGVVN
jgi:hypothetical protein